MSERLRVNVYYSPESHSYFAESPDLDGLAATGRSRGEVEQEALYAAETLFDLKGINARPDLQFQDASFPPE